MKHSNPHIKLSIIIVEYNTKDLVIECLESLGLQKDIHAWEVIVIDNDSHDGSIEALKKFKENHVGFPLRITFNAGNVGFAKANNQGIALAKGEYILLLNSDTQVTSTAISDMIKFLDLHSDIGVVTCKLVLPNGHIDPACHRGFPTPWAAFTYFSGLERLLPQTRLFGQYHQGYKNMNVAHAVDAISGAFFMIRRQVIDEVGALDEDFFMYGEDLDWAYRIKKSGWAIYFNPVATVLHRKSQSGKSNRNDKLRTQTKQYFYDTMKLFYKKHYARRYSPFVYWLVLLGIKLRSHI